jgi:uncharacterized protein involved in high-affinity Fe2+ transport
MRRRDLLRGAGVAGLAGLAGCLGLVETRAARAPEPLEDPPNRVYRPTHVEGMVREGQATAGDVRVAVTYSFPHRFWTVTNREVSMTDIDEADSVHLMTVAFDKQTGVYLPDTGLTVELTREDELVSQEVIYPMVAQRMGFHYGGNFPLPGDGTYTARVQVGGVGTRRTGAFRDRFTEPATGTARFSFSEADREAIQFRTLDDAGSPGAVEPMEMAGIPEPRLPAPADLPGETLGTPTSGDAVLATQLLDPPAGIEGERYLAVSARTPYNRVPLPMAALEATVSRGSETAFEGPLRPTLDPALQYHYGAAVPALSAGDEIRLRVNTPPQVARHEGYETAFLEMPDATVTVP